MHLLCVGNIVSMYRDIIGHCSEMTSNAHNGTPLVFVRVQSLLGVHKTLQRINGIWRIYLDNLKDMMSAGVTIRER